MIIIACKECRKKYSIDASLFTGKTVKFKCKNCNYIITVNKPDSKFHQDSTSPIMGESHQVLLNELEENFIKTNRKLSKTLERYRFWGSYLAIASIIFMLLEGYISFFAPLLAILSIFLASLIFIKKQNIERCEFSAEEESEESFAELEEAIGKMQSTLRFRKEKYKKKA